MSECECKTMARASKKATELFLKHHPSCEHYEPESEVRDLLLRLIVGIEEWASDEDGVHEDCWDAYRDACAAVGQWTRPSSGSRFDEVKPFHRCSYCGESMEPLTPTLYGMHLECAMKDEADVERDRQKDEG